MHRQKPISKPRSSIRPILFTSLVLQAVFLPAAPVPIPEWARPVEDQLPKIPPSIISEVDDLFRVMSDSRHAPDDSGKPADSEYVRASLRLIQLREQTDQAVIWQYLKEPDPTLSQQPNGESLRGAETTAALRRQRLLPRLSYNTGLSQWMLPLLRQRMKWMTVKLQEHQIDGYHAIGEIAGMSSYLYSQGEIADLTALEQLIAAGIKEGYFAGFFDDRKSLDEQMATIRQVRAMDRLRATPYWVSLGQYLVNEGLVDKNSLNLTYDPKIYSSAELNPMKSQSSYDAPEQNRLKTATTSLSNVILAALALTVIVLLALMLRKRPDAV